MSSTGNRTHTLPRLITLSHAYAPAAQLTLETLIILLNFKLQLGHCLEVSQPALLVEQMVVTENLLISANDISYNYISITPSPR